MEARYQQFTIPPDNENERVVVIIDQGRETYWANVGAPKDLFLFLFQKPAVFFYLPVGSFAVVKAYKTLPDDVVEGAAKFTFEYEVFKSRSLHDPASAAGLEFGKAGEDAGANTESLSGFCDIECGQMIVSHSPCELGQEGTCDDNNPDCASGGG